VPVNRVLIKGATIVTMDDALGDLMSGDVLVEGGRIAAVQPSIDAGDAEIVDDMNKISRAA
jgi:5-methylthioadenosine/S-adenosylhomocysteine deaminase